MLVAGLGGNCKDALIDILNQFGKNGVTFYTDLQEDSNIPFFKKHGLNLAVGPEAAMQHFRTKGPEFFSIIGNNHHRANQVVCLEELGGKPVSYISTTAMVNKEFSIISDRNVVIMHFANISADAIIDEGAIIYAYTAIAHNVHVGKYTFFSAHCAVSNATIGEFTFVGLNAMINPGVTVGSNCIIGANAYVNKDVPNGATAYGVPVKIKMPANAQE
jgi:acetyltransferase-like isoleucine patch superfamily enzyme